MSKDRTPKSSQSKHPLASAPFVTPSQAQLMHRNPGGWHQQSKSTELLIPLPVVSPVPPALERRCPKQTNKNPSDFTPTLTLPQQAAGGR